MHAPKRRHKTNKVLSLVLCEMRRRTLVGGQTSKTFPLSSKRTKSQLPLFRESNINAHTSQPGPTRSSAPNPTRMPRRSDGCHCCWPRYSRTLTPKTRKSRPSGKEEGEAWSDVHRLCGGTWTKGWHWITRNKGLSIRRVSVEEWGARREILQGTG
jgi:hypothetical protein